MIYESPLHQKERVIKMKFLRQSFQMDFQVNSTFWPWTGTRPSMIFQAQDLMVSSQLKLSNFGCWGQGELIDTHILELWNKKYQWIFAHPECLKVPSQLKMFNLDCWDPGDSIDFCKKVQNLKFPTKRPLGGLRTSRGQDPKPSFQALQKRKNTYVFQTLCI